MKGNWLKRLIGFVESLVFPDGVTCLCCSRGLGEDETDGVCPACRQALERMAHEQAESDPDGTHALAPGIAHVYAAYPYEAQARRLILMMKVNCLREAAVPLCRAMSALNMADADVLVPVPTSAKRIRERGFNQAVLLAQGVGKACGKPVREALVRVSERGKQSLLSARERRKNLTGSMRADGSVRGLRVAVVDDVYTTGSTAAEAARALREAGAADVFVLCAARTGRGRKAVLADFDRLRVNVHRNDKGRGKI